MQNLTAGTVLTCEAGSFGNTRYYGPFLVLRDFSPDEIAAKFLQRWTPQNKRMSKPSPISFVRWMKLERYIEEIDYNATWYLGDKYLDVTFQPETSDGKSNVG